MDEQEFWDIVSQHAPRDPETPVVAAESIPVWALEVEQLLKLSKAELIAMIFELEDEVGSLRESDDL